MNVINRMLSYEGYEKHGHPVPPELPPFFKDALDAHKKRPSPISLATQVRRPGRDGAKRRSRRGGTTTATAAATQVRRPRRDGAERRSKSVRREKHNSDGGGEEGAAVEERWRRAAIKARGH